MALFLPSCYGSGTARETLELLLRLLAGVCAYFRCKEPLLSRWASVDNSPVVELDPSGASGNANAVVHTQRKHVRVDRTVLIVL